MSTSYLVLAALLGLAVPGTEPASDDAADPPPATDEPRFAAHGQVAWLSAVRGLVPRDTAVNPRNTALALPQAFGESELRPDLRLEYGSMLSFVARPRLVASVGRAKLDGAWKRQVSNAELEWLDLYGTWRLDDAVSVSYGRQNFQWGPAELASPSNRIFHESGFLRDPLYRVVGKDLARVNLSLGRAWSAVVLAEVADNGERFVAGEPFEPKGQLKVEYAAAGGAANVGLTVGAARSSRTWFGEYATLPLAGGLSAYADASHGNAAHVWYPVDLGGGRTNYEQARLHDDRLRTRAVVGLRYDFERGDIVRVEAVYDEDGYSRTELELAAKMQAAPAAPYFGGLGSGAPQPPPYALPGLEFLGQRLVYLSLHLPDLPPTKRLSAELRYLYSVTDGSGAMFVNANLAASDATIVFVSATAPHGRAWAELSRQARGALVLGATHTW